MKNNITLISVSFCLSLLTGAASAGSMDPVSANEINRARSMAMPSTNNTTPDISRHALMSATDSVDVAAPTVEFLRVQPHRFSKSALSSNKRWADTTAYDYATDELITTVVDLDNNEVLSIHRSKNMQPPMAQAEIQRAIEIVFQDDEERRILNAEFARITGATLTSIDQLQYKAFTFLADSMPNAVNSASESCGVNRCAQLLLYTHENVVFEVSPIVNLSAGLVTQHMGY